MKLLVGESTCSTQLLMYSLDMYVSLSMILWIFKSQKCSVKALMLAL